MTLHFTPWRASTLNCRYAQSVRGIPKSRHGESDQGQPLGAFWGGSRASGREEYWGDLCILLLPLCPATISKSPIWDKVSHALAETGIALEREAKNIWVQSCKQDAPDCHFYCRPWQRGDRVRNMHGHHPHVLAEYLFLWVKWPPSSRPFWNYLLL